MPIPELDLVTGNLPPGIHTATWEEIVATFGVTPHRVWLLSGLQRALDSLREAGCSRAYIDGSFVTAKDEPADFDGCWSAVGVDPALLDPTLLDFRNRRAAQKAKFGGELFVGTRYLDFFQRDKNGNPKGIIVLDLGAVT